MGVRFLRCPSWHGDEIVNPTRHTKPDRCDACRMFLLRHGRDKEPREVQRGWERAIDKAFDLKDWR